MLCGPRSFARRHGAASSLSAPATEREPMTIPASRVCLVDDCRAPMELATAQDLETGQHLWQCANGHHGPAIIGFHGYAAP